MSPKKCPNERNNSLAATQPSFKRMLISLREMISKAQLTKKCLFALEDI